MNLTNNFTDEDREKFRNKYRGSANIKECLNCHSTNLYGNTCGDCRYRMIVTPAITQSVCPNCDNPNIKGIRDMSGDSMCFTCQTRVRPKTIVLKEEKIEVSEY